MEHSKEKVPLCLGKILTNKKTTLNKDPVSLTTIGAGAITYIVGPVTGAAIGANSTVMALSIAAGVIKSIVVMISTPYVAKMVGLTNPRTAVIFGGAMGTASGVAGGLAATKIPN